MKIQKPLIAVAALCAFIGLQAKANDIIQTITLTVTATAQNNNGTSNGTTTNVPPPSISTHTTTEFLTRLAQDENIEGHWSSNSFPAGVKLAVVPGNSNGADFAVIQGTNVLVDVSDIISFDGGNNEIVSGAQNLQTGLASPMTKKAHLGRINFDDSAVGNPNGSLTFFLQGIFTETTMDTAPTSTGAYTETRMAKMTTGAGEGSKGGNPFVCTGMINATGKANLQLVP